MSPFKLDFEEDPSDLPVWVILTFVAVLAAVIMAISQQ